jgi:glycolate oxidase iron-sulfur subunit
MLRDDPKFAAKAARITALSRDVSVLLGSMLPQLTELTRGASPERVAFHAPCSLQHGLKLRGSVESLLSALGAQLVTVRDAHLCCGSAGTYSLLHPATSRRLRDDRLDALQAGEPSKILSANIGCMVQLASASRVPVMHWVQWLEGRLR